MIQARVLLADSQALMLAGLQHILTNSGNFQIVGETDDAHELDKLLLNTEPDILVMDYAKLKNFSIELCYGLISRFPWVRLIIITNDRTPKKILDVLHANVMGFITKECSKQEVLTTFELVRNGQKFFCNRVLDLLMERQEKKVVSEELKKLSEREIEIIKYISEGLSTQQLAGKLHLSPHTVNAHRKNILKKLHVSTPVELIVKAVQMGIIRLS